MRSGHGLLARAAWIPPADLPHSGDRLPRSPRGDANALGSPPGGVLFSAFAIAQGVSAHACLPSRGGHAGIAAVIRRQWEASFSGSLRYGFQGQSGARGAAVAYASTGCRGFLEVGVSAAVRASDSVIRGSRVRIPHAEPWIAQTGRASDCKSECRGFDSRSKTSIATPGASCPTGFAPRRLAAREPAASAAGSRDVRWQRPPDRDPARARGRPACGSPSAFTESAPPTPCRPLAHAGSPSGWRRGEPFSCGRRGIRAARPVPPQGLVFGSSTRRRLAIRCVFALAHAGILQERACSRPAGKAHCGGCGRLQAGSSTEGAGGGVRVS